MTPRRHEMHVFGQLIRLAVWNLRRLGADRKVGGGWRRCGVIEGFGGMSSLKERGEAYAGRQQFGK